VAADAGSLFAPLVAAAERAGVADFLRWWRAELFAMLPPGWRERLSSRDAAYLRAGDDEWVALRPVAGRLAQGGRTAFASLDGAGRRAAFRRLLAEGGGSAGNVWLVLPPDSVLVRDVHMPLAAEESLREAVGFDLDRFTPLPAEQAWFDYRVSGRDAGSQRLQLKLAVAASAPIEAKLAELRELGATVLGVGVEDDVAGAATPFNLLPPEKRDRPAVSRSAVAVRVLAAAAGVLALAALVIPLWVKRDAAIALYPRLESARAGADVAERLAREIEKLAGEHNFIVGRKQGQQPAVALLEDLSRLLPDTTWVQQFDLKTGPRLREVQLAGETGSSSQLIEVLERSGTLANASFKSPLTKGITPGTERFLLTAEVKPRPLPEPMPETALAAPAAVAAPAPAPVPPAAPAAALPAASPPAPAAGAVAPAPSNGAAPQSVPGATPQPAPGAATADPAAAPAAPAPARRR
jgi:general secretion pathway protein L